MAPGEVARAVDRGVSTCTVVIPTHDRRASLMRTLVALGAQDRLPDEVIVVCDGCTDDSPRAARSLGTAFRLRVLEQAQGGPAAARNAGLEAARGDVVVFIDDDVVPAPGFLAAHLDAHAHDAGLVVIGPLLPPAGWGSPWVRWEMRTVLRQYELMRAGDFRPGPRQFYTGNASVGRAHVLAAGGFDPRFKRAEDVELAFRLEAGGLRFTFEPRAAAQHLAERSFDSWVRAARQYGRNDVILGRSRNRPDMLAAIASEYHERHRLTRLAVRLGLAGVDLPAALLRLVCLGAVYAQRAGAERLAHAACSAAFNHQYWIGVAEEMGDRRAVRDLLGAHANQASAH